MGWKVSNGKSIRLGTDPIVGLNSSYVLFEGLRDYLCDCGITTLNEAHNFREGTNLQSYWLYKIDLDLGRSWKVQWTYFIKGMTHRGIILKEVKDSLLWMQNKVIGVVSTSLAYDLIVSSLLPVSLVRYHSCLWCCNVPLKVKCFTWINIENRINTWDNLTKKRMD